MGQGHPRRSTRKRDKSNPHIAQISVMPFFLKKSVPARAMDFCISRVIRPLPYLTPQNCHPYFSMDVLKYGWEFWRVGGIYGCGWWAWLAGGGCG